jgi:hypothetical protein
MQLHGRVQSVTIEESGDSLSADFGAGASVISVYDAYDFSVTGGTVSVGADLLNYTTCNYANNTITLAGATPNSYFQDQSVRVYPYGETKIAIVALGEGEQGVRAAIPFEMVDRFRDGIRDPADQESVLIDDESGHWTVKSVDEEVPLVSGRYLDPTTIPTYEPGTPPPNSPAITAFGLPSSIMVKTDDDTVAQSTFIQYHISLTDGFTPGPTTLVHSGRDQVYVITQLHDGTPLAANTNYYLRTIAYNTAGAAAPSAQVGPVQLDLSVINSFVTQQLVASVIIAAAIQAGGVAVGNITIDPSTGITIPQPNGGVIKFPADSTEAVVTAQLIATALTMKNNTIMQDLITMYGQMKVANGIVDPVIAPTVLDDWWTRIYPAVSITGTPFSNITDDGSTNWVVLSFSGSSIYRTLVDKTTMVAAGSSLLISAGGGWNPQSMVRIGTDFYVLEGNGTGVYKIRKWNSSWVDQGQLNWSHTDPAHGGQVNSVTLGTDGTNFYIMHALIGTVSPFNVFIHTWGWTTASTPVNIFTGTPWDTGSSSIANWSSLCSISRGSFDIAADRIILGRSSATLGSVAFSVSGTTLTRQTTDEFPTAAAIVNSGLWWDGSNFWQHNLTIGTISRYSTNKLADTIFVRYTWADIVATGGLHETAASPSTTFTRKKRAGITTIGKPAPQEALSGNDVANRVVMYVGDAANDTRLQSSQPAQGVSSIFYEDPPLNSGAVAPTTNNWGVLGAVGIIQSTNYVAGTSGWMLKGDGTEEHNGSGWIAFGAAGGAVWGPGWTNNTGTTEQGASKKVGNTVTVAGLVWRTSGSGLLIATLPVGQRPSKGTYRMCLISNGWLYVVIDTNGDISASNFTTAPVNSANAVGLWFQFDTNQP